MQQQDAAHVVAEAARQYAEELGRWRQQRRLSKQKLATLMTYDRSYVSHVESGSLPPTEDFTRRAEAVLNTASALWARWEAYEAARIGNARASSRSVDRLEPIASERQRDLKVSPFVAWVADHSRLSFQDAYGVVVRGVERLAARGPADRYAEAHRRAQITRDQLARALATYYQNPSPHELGATFYSARVDGVPLALSILVRPDWLGAAVRLGTNQERFQLAAPDVGTAVRLPEGPALEAALRRLAAAETSATVMVNNPLYRLQDVALSRQRLQATVTLTDLPDPRPPPGPPLPVRRPARSRAGRRTDNGGPRPRRWSGRGDGRVAVARRLPPHRGLSLDPQRSPVRRWPGRPAGRGPTKHAPRSARAGLRLAGPGAFRPRA